MVSFRDALSATQRHYSCPGKSADTLSIAWRMFVKQFGDYWSLANDRTLDQDATLVVGSFMGLLVQSYFIHRAFMLSKNRYFLVIASLFALSGPVASIAYVGIVQLKVFNFRLFTYDSRWVVLFDMLMPYFYVNSLLFTLNSRSRLKVTGEVQITRKSDDRLWSKQNERTTEVYVTTTSQSQGARVS
ncbi:hypothetical protein FRC09_017627 [Ceratobasidium sp. 395]|nr:hypothetical protein FRC09_017627 [Ceratobasidium sp. 395]